MSLDGALIGTDRLRKPAISGNGHDLGYSGKHHHPGGDVQVLTDSGGFPLWTSPGEPSSTYDITAARAHVLPVLYPAAGTGLPTLADKG